MRSFTATVVFDWSDFRAPPVLDGSGTHKRGSPIPVKFALTGAGSSVTTPAARLDLDGVAVGTFRYDASAGQYVADLSTPSYAAGVHQLSAVFGDGRVTDADVHASEVS